MEVKIYTFHNDYFDQTFVTITVETGGNTTSILYQCFQNKTLQRFKLQQDQIKKT